MKQSQNVSKTTEKRKVKGSIVTSKTGKSFFRQEHQRTMEVNIDKNQLLISVLSNKLQKSNIVGTKKISPLDEGITANVLHVALQDNAGNVNYGYFKGIEDDVFITQDNLDKVSEIGQIDPETGDIFKEFFRPSIKLTTKDTDTPLSQDEHLEAKTLPDHGRSKYKGHQMDREIASATLGKALGMDHIPELTVKRDKFYENEPEKLGIVVGDILKDFKKDDTKQIVKGADDPRLLFKSMRTDKKIGDKAVFDYLIGNVDRHKNNYFLRENGDNSVDFIAFDHGLTFPNNNNVMKNYQANGPGAEHPGKHTSVTPEFAENLSNFLQSDKLNDFVTFLRENVGKKEHLAFMDRLYHVVDSIFNKNALTMNRMLA